MSADPIPAIEYETMVLSRHLASLPGRSRRRGGILDQSAYTLLCLLQVGGAASIGSLSSVTGLDASTLHRQTAGLLRDGYAERIPDPEGGRARKFRLTEKGERVLDEERQSSKDALARITSDWPESDVAAFGTLLNRFNRAVEQHHEHTWPRP